MPLHKGLFGLSSGSYGIETSCFGFAHFSHFLHGLYHFLAFHIPGVVMPFHVLKLCRLLLEAVFVSALTVGSRCLNVQCQRVIIIAVLL